MYFPFCIVYLFSFPQRNDMIMTVPSSSSICAYILLLGYFQIPRNNSNILFLIFLSVNQIKVVVTITTVSWMKLVMVAIAFDHATPNPAVPTLFVRATTTGQFAVVKMDMWVSLLVIVIGHLPRASASIMRTALLISFATGLTESACLLACLTTVVEMRNVR